MIDIHKLIYFPVYFIGYCCFWNSGGRYGADYFLCHFQIRQKHNVQSRKEVLRYEALPGVETVHSSLVVRATQDLFKNNKIKLQCLATMFSMYRRSQEVELQENPTQLALIMVPTTQSKQGRRIYQMSFYSLRRLKSFICV